MELLKTNWSDSHVSCSVSLPTLDCVYVPLIVQHICQKESLHICSSFPVLFSSLPFMWWRMKMFCFSSEILQLGRLEREIQLLNSGYSEKCIPHPWPRGKCKANKWSSLDVFIQSKLNSKRKFGDIITCHITSTSIKRCVLHFEADHVACVFLEYIFSLQT